MAGTEGEEDEEPFEGYITDFKAALRTVFPVTRRALQTFQPNWAEKMNPAKWVVETMEERSMLTGETPASGSPQEDALRQKILDGVPVSVKVQMQENPLVGMCKDAAWRQCLVHYLSNYQKKALEQSKTRDDAATLLTRLQLEEEQKKRMEEKKAAPTQTVAAAPPPVATPPPYPNAYDNLQPPPTPMSNPHYAVQYQYPPAPYGRGMGRGRSQNRGRGGPAVGRGPGVDDVCRACGGRGHWARDCPFASPQHQPHPYPVHPWSVLLLYQAWRPFVETLGLYLPTVDPPHCTLNYDCSQDLENQERFISDLQGHCWELTTTGIFCGPEGVAAAILLTPKQQSWYQLANSAFPHVSFALSPHHQAKELGTMIKKASLITDWEQTQIPEVLCSASNPQFVNIELQATDNTVLEHHKIARHHGEERSDPPEAASVKANAPSWLWATGPFDVGQCHIAPITFQIDQSRPEYRPLYKISPEAMAGLQDTTEGFQAAGVIRPTCSPWKTPLLLVLKADGKSYRMTHDL